MSRAAPKAVLVIDDDPDYCELVRGVLEGDGLVVLVAGDCARGLDVLERERPRIGLILLDYWLPGMRPLPCASSLRERAGGDIAIVLVTAASNAGERARELGLTRWLAKPFDLEQLRRLVQALLSPLTK